MKPKFYSRVLPTTFILLLVAACGGSTGIWYLTANDMPLKLRYSRKL